MAEAPGTLTALAALGVAELDVDGDVAVARDDPLLVKRSPLRDGQRLYGSGWCV